MKPSLNNKSSTVEPFQDDFSFLVWFHAIFFAFAALALFPCLKSLSEQQDNVANDDDASHHGPCQNNDPAIALLIVGWNVAFPFLAHYQRHTRLVSFYKFAALVSIFQVLPDWFLVERLDTLTFPLSPAAATNNSSWASSWKVGGAVSWYMAGMWTIPFVLVYGLSHSGENKAITNTTDAAVDGNYDYRKAAVASLIIFGLAELFLYPLEIWQCHNVQQTWGSHVAVYVLPGEALIGPAVLYAYEHTKQLSFGQQLFAAFMVSLMYTGALAIGHLLIES